MNMQEGNYMAKFNRDLDNERLANIEKIVREAEKGDIEERKIQQRELWKVLSMYGLNLNDVRGILDYFQIDIKSSKLPSLKELAEMLIPEQASEETTYVAKPLDLIQLEDTFVPTKDESVLITPNPDGERFKEKEIIPRLKILKEFLKANGLDVHDSREFRILKGQNTSEMMRKESYLLLILPSLSSMILVCEEEGNITFVIRDLPEDPKQYYKLSKDELKAHPKVAPPVRWSNQEDWQDEILDRLTDPRTVFDKIGGEKKDSRTSRIRRTPETKDWTLDQWREAIKAEVGTAEDWVNKIFKKRIQIKVKEKGLAGLFTVFGIDPKGRINHSLYYYTLGLEVWPESKLIQQEYEKSARDLAERESSLEETKNWDLDQWREAVKAVVPDPKKWADIRYPETTDVNVKGNGFEGLARLFGVAGNPAYNIFDRLELGLQIWPGDEFLQKRYDEKKKERELDEETKDWTPDQWRAAIKAEIPTPQDWLNMTASDKYEKHIKGKGLWLVAKKFGLGGHHPGNNLKYHCELGLQIWPGDEELQKQYDKSTKELEISTRQKTETKNWTLDQWREAVYAVIPNWQKFVSLKPQELRLTEYSVKGKGVLSLSTTFGTNGNNPTYNKAHRLELACKIWPGDEELKRQYDESVVEWTRKEKLRDESKDWTTDNWRDAIIRNDKTKTPQDWVGLVVADVVSLEIHGRGIRYIAKIFGIDGREIYKRHGFLSLGLEIWPDNPVILEALEKLEKK